MEKEIIFIKLDYFKSKKNGKEYYTIDYLFGDDLNYHKDFINEEIYDKLCDLDLECLERYLGVFEFNNFMKVSLVDVKTL